MRQIWLALGLSVCLRLNAAHPVDVPASNAATNEHLVAIQAVLESQQQQNQQNAARLEFLVTAGVLCVGFIWGAKTWQLIRLSVSERHFW